jgi:hypothetical protein
MIKTMPDQVTRIITLEATGIATMRETFKIQTYAVSIRKTAKALCRTAGRGNVTNSFKSICHIQILFF